MTKGDDRDPPSAPPTGPEGVKAAMKRRRRVTLTVVEGGLPENGKPKARKGSPKRSIPEAVGRRDRRDRRTERGASKSAGQEEPFDPSAVPGAKMDSRVRGNDGGGEGEPPGEGGEGSGRPPGMDDADWETARRCAELDHNDRDNGRRLCIWFGQDLAYVPGMGWLTFRGTHWQRDDGELGARLLAQELVDKIKLECFHIEATPAQRRAIEAARALRGLAEFTPAQARTIKTADGILKQLSEKRSKRRSFAVTSGNAGRTAAMLAQAASLKAIDQNLLDADHLAFNVRNGTLHFSRLEDPEQDLTPEADGTPIPPRFVGEAELRPHDRAEMITKLADVEYDPDATCPEFQKFLERVQPDPKDRLFLQVFHGYALMIGGNGAQVLVFHYGTGANGKSAFIEATGRLAGSYRAVVSPDTLTGDSQRQGQQASPDIARLFNSRYVTVEELPKHLPLREELIKAASGGTKMVARFLQKDPFEFLPIFTAVLSGNHKPTISGSDEGIWRRMRLMPWAVTIPESERIPFDDLMRTFDAERSGILNWLVEGAKLYLAKGLEPFTPPKVRAFTDDYRQERDNVGVFARVGMERHPGSTIRAGVLYQAYKDWCEVNGLPAAKQTPFGNRLMELGFEKDRGAFYVYTNVRLTDAAGAKYDPPPRDDADPGWRP